MKWFWCRKNELLGFSKEVFEWFKDLPVNAISLSMLYEHPKFSSNLALLNCKWLSTNIGNYLSRWILKIYLDDLIANGFLEIIHCELDSDNLSCYKIKGD